MCMDTMSLKNAILEGVLSAVRSHPSVTLGQLGDVEALGFDLRAVPASRLLSKNTVTRELIVDLSGVVHDDGIPRNHRPDYATGAKTRTKVQRANFDAAVLWILAEIAIDDASVGWSALFVGNKLAERGHGNPTPEQLRKSLHRLIGLKQIKQSGKARGTRYTATAKGVKAFEKMGAA